MGDVRGDLLEKWLSAFFLAASFLLYSATAALHADEVVLW